MASQWYSLVSQKLFLARTLLAQIDAPGSETANEAELALRRESIIQGTIELLLRSRKLSLVMIARFHQHKHEEPTSLEQLAALIGEGSGEVSRLRDLERNADSWWNHLDQLEVSQSRPPVPRKTVSAENVIAVAEASGPDRSVAALGKTLTAMKNFADNLEEQHSEW